MSADGWGWGDKGKKAHWFPDATDRAKCGKAVKVEDAPDVPVKDRCAACRKAADVSASAAVREAADNTPTPVRVLRVRVPPGGDACPSTVHAGDDVRANWTGVLTGAAGPMLVGDEWTGCDWCAWLLVGVGFVDLDLGLPPLCVRCESAFAVGRHDPCCSSAHPHNRPLCCHCYAVTHHVEGVPCH